MPPRYTGPRRLGRLSSNANNSNSPYRTSSRTEANMGAGQPVPGMAGSPVPTSAAASTAQPGSGVATIERTDTITVPGLPGFSPSSATPTTTTVVSSEANLGLQYIASAGPRLPIQFGAPYGLMQGAGIHVLPLYIDMLEEAMGLDMYLRMMNDAVVKASDGSFRDAVLDKPAQVMSACDENEKDATRRAFAQNVRDFVAANLEGVPGGFSVVSREMLEGIALGYKLGELEFELREIIPGNGPQTCLSRIAPKPQEAASIVVDQYNHELGYLPRFAGSGLFGTFLFGDLGVKTLETQQQEVDIPGLVPPEKVWRFTWMMRNDDPRGVSHLRAAYVPWRLKIGLYPAYEAWLARFAQPSAAIELGGMETLPPVAGADGKLLKDPVAITRKMLLDLQNFGAGGAMVLPVGTLKLIQAISNGQAYLAAFELCNNEITQSIIYAELSTQGGKYGTQALGEVHQDTKGLLIAYAKQVYATSVRERVVKPLVMFNYGEEGLKVLPKISFGEVEQQDFSTASSGYSQLKQAQLLFPPQYNDMYEALHVTPLDEEDITLLTEAWRTGLAAQVAMAEQAAQGPQNSAQGQPGQPGGAPGQPGQQGNGNGQGNGQPGQDQGQQGQQGGYWG